MGENVSWCNGTFNIIKAAQTHTDADGQTVTFQPIEDLDALKKLFVEGGSGYLANNIDCTAALTVAASKTVNLCLNDKVLNLNSTNIEVGSDAHFNLYDCGKSVRYWDKDETGLWTLKTTADTSDRSTTGGVITGGKSESYGGCVKNFGSFTMTGGSIVGNTSPAGGGVYMASRCEFTMTGGSITGNTATSGGGIESFGTLNLLAGEGKTIEIIGNTAEASEGGRRLRRLQRGYNAAFRQSHH